MKTPGAADILIAARGVLFDAMDALPEQRSALVLVGAQAICLHTGRAPCRIGGVDQRFGHRDGSSHAARRSAARGRDATCGIHARSVDDTTGELALAARRPSRSDGSRATRWCRWQSQHDTTYDFDNKIDAAILLGDEKLTRSFCDSLERHMQGRALSTLLGPDGHAMLAFAQATLGDTVTALASLDRMFELARTVKKVDRAGSVLPADRIATVYARLGDTRMAVAWLDSGLQSRFTVQFYATHPRLATIRASPEWKQFVLEHLR